LTAPGLPRWRRHDRILASRARTAGIWTAFAGVVVTLVFKVVPGLDFAYRRPALRAGLETAEALVALLVAYLVIGRLARTRSVDDLVAAVALGALAGGNLVFGVLPTLMANGRADPIAGWGGVGIRLTGAVLFALAAVAPRRPLARRLPTGPTAIALTIGVIAVVALAAAALEHRLPQPAIPAADATAVKQLASFGHGRALLVQIATMCACLVAAVGFARTADRHPDDELLPWFGAAAVFGTYASLNYAISPALFYTDWVYPADVVLLLFYLMLLVGAVREINGYWRGLARAAASDERRRLARDLHDGLAQELAYMSRSAKQLRWQVDVDLAEVVDRFDAAAQRALQESRQVIAALASSAEPLAAVLERVAYESAARYAVDVDLDVATGPRLDAARLEALVRITGEAVANAARHSGTTRVRVRLEWRGGRPWLQVADHGVGFEPGVVAHRDGFGLTSMQERAAAVGARLRLETAPGAGTTLEVAF
jgi:signal transduction histidine kinase